MLLAPGVMIYTHKYIDHLVLFQSSAAIGCTIYSAAEAVFTSPGISAALALVGWLSLSVYNKF